MKKYILSGHGRILTPLGEKEHSRGVPSEGWKVECKCGWNKESLKNKREAESEYAKHIEFSLPICSECGEAKAPRFMSKSNHTLCKKCSVEKTKKWAEENPSRWERSRRSSHLMKTYGITIEDFNKMLEEQNHKCLICEGDLIDIKGHRPHVDHCHTTGIVRGILCGDCNKGLGIFKDDINRIKNAYNYLLKYEGIIN